MTDTITTTPPRVEAPRRIVLQLLEHMRDGTTHECGAVMPLQAGIFSDAEVARRERRQVFGRVPFIAAHSSELPAPHDFITKRLPGNDVVIVRQPDRSVRTFVNQCRHRGARLESQAAGHCRAFSCAYHGWSYDLDGSLRSISYQESFGDVDRSQLGLIELPTEERHGFVWVVDDPSGTIDVAGWLGATMDELLGAYRLDTLVCARSGSFDEPVNWKIMHDAFLDGYHIKFVHPKSAARVIHTNTYVVEDLGRHAYFASPRKSLDQWLDADPDPAIPMLEHVMITHHIGPNCTLLQLADHFEILTFMPVGDDPARSVMEMRLLVPDQAVSGMGEQEWNDHWDKNWHILQAVLAGEDFPLLRDIQRAFASADAGGCVLGRNEVNNQIFHREIARLRDAE